MSVEINLIPYTVTISLLLIIFLLVWNLRNIVTLFSKINNKKWIILFIIIILSVILRLFISPWHHIVYFDEWANMESARQMFLSGKLSLCQVGNLESCVQRAHYQHPIPFPAVIPFFYFLIGIGGIQAQFVNLFFGVATVLLTFFIAFLLFRKVNIALWSSFFLSLMPLHLLHSTSANYDAFSVFFITLTVLSFLIYLSRNDNKSLLLAIFTLAYTIQVKMEFLNLLLLVSSLLFLFRSKVKINKFYLIFIILIIPHVFFIANNYGEFYNIASTTTVDTIHIFRMDNIKAGLIYVKFWFNFQHIIFTLLAIIGAFLINKYTKQILFLLVWIFSFLTIYMFYWNNGDLRYILVLTPAIAILAGVGVNYVLSCRKNILKIILSLFVILFTLANASIFVDWPPISVSHKEIIFIKYFDEVIDESGFITTSTPFLINFILDRDAVISGAINSLRELLRNGAKIYFYENVFCFGAMDSDHCKNIHETFDLRIIKSVVINGQRTTLYEIINEK